jgi:hypothetical protein
MFVSCPRSHDNAAPDNPCSAIDSGRPWELLPNRDPARSHLTQAWDRALHGGHLLQVLNNKAITND